MGVRVAIDLEESDWRRPHHRLHRNLSVPSLARMATLLVLVRHQLRGHASTRHPHSSGSSAADGLWSGVCVHKVKVSILAVAELVCRSRVLRVVCAILREQVDKVGG